MSPTWRWSVVLCLALLGTVPLQAQSLQLHFMDVGQGDGAVVSYGRLDAVMGGDLSGFEAQGYLDIESSVASKFGQVEVYKVNHHCSAYSTNDTWLETIKPRVGIISVGKKNRYGHPAPD